MPWPVTRSNVAIVRILFERLAVFLTLVVALFALADSPALLVGAIAAIALVTIVASRYAAINIRSHSLTVGARARAHRELLSSLPAPSHPDTAGRTRSRAPSQSLAAAF